MERQYIIPLRREWLKVPRTRRAKRAIKAIKEFIARHMKVEEIKLGPEVNKVVWRRGIQKPPGKIKVKVMKKENVCYVELPENFEKFVDTFLKKEVKEETKEEKKESKEEKKEETEKESKE